MRRRIMLVDPMASSQDYVDFMTDHLGIDFDLCICSTADECFGNLSLFDPDFIYINMTITDAVPMTLLHDIKIVSGPTPIIIGTDPYDTYYTRQLRSLNVYRVLITPYSMEEVGRQLCEIATFGYPVNSGYAGDTLDYILLRLGFKCTGAKYECIRYAVELKSRNANLRVMKELYPALAERVNGTITSVEKGMRDAIRCARLDSKERLWPSLFPYAESETPVSNDEFISRIALAVKHCERPRITMEEFLSRRSCTI